MQNGVRLCNLNRCKIKDSCEVCCFVFPSCVEFCFLRFGLFSIMTKRRLIWIHISWPGIWYRGNGLRGPMRTQRGAPAVQLHLPICLWCCRPPLHRELHFLPERSSGRWLHAEHANFTYIYKYRSTHAYTFNEPALHQHAIGHILIIDQISTTIFYNQPHTLLKMKVLHDNIEEPFLAVWLHKPSPWLEVVRISGRERNGIIKSNCCWLNKKMQQRMYLH